MASAPRAACWRATLSDSVDRSMPVTRAPCFASASARMPPPQPTSTTRGAVPVSRSVMKRRRRPLMACNWPILPCGSHHSWAMRSKWAISAASTFGESVMGGCDPGLQGGDGGVEFAAADVVDEHAGTDGDRQRHALGAIAVLDAIEQRLPHQRAVEQFQRRREAEPADQGEDA